ncbi:MAG: hypothetical protein KAH17_03450 [Bacteroidales bacterium]|nr:hypothetical protein [Bacteroidales bacterium]
MEKITRNNIEAWMLDYQEGNLSDGMIDELMAFLKSNPDIQIDPDFSDFQTLEAPELSFSRKADLFRTDLNLPELSEDEIECISRIEGDMILSEEKAFDESLETDTKKAMLLSALKQSVLIADTGIVCENKSSLHKRVILIPRFVYGLVSAAAILIFAWFVFSPGSEIVQDPQQIAKEARQIIYLNKIVNPSKFDKIASANPLKTIAKPGDISILESIVNPEFDLASISLAGKLPIRLINSSSRVADKSYAFIYRTLPYPEDVEYQTLLAYSGKVIRERILGQDADFVQQTKFSIWELADVGIEKISDFLSIPVEMDREYNDRGQLESIAFDSPLMAFSTPISGRRSR